MRDQVGDLLERAAGGVRPRERDPVAAVLGRVRAARRRRMVGAAVAAVAACAVAAGAVLAAGPQRQDPVDPPVEYATPVTGPATVTVENGVLRAGGLRLPLPPGWTVATTDRPICETPARTLFINSSAGPGGPCDGMQPLITVRGAAAFLPPPGRRSGWRQMILPGGQPAWLTESGVSALDPTAPDGEYRALTLVVPWSGVQLTFTMTRAEMRPIVAAIRTQPVAPGPLVLPAGAVRAELLAKGTDAASATIEDAARVEELRAQLAGLKEPAPVDAGCPVDTELRAIVFSDADNRMLAAVLLSSTAGCSEATSSRGGRVKIPADLWGRLSEKVTR